MTVAGEVAGGGTVRELPYGAALTLGEPVEIPSPCDTPPVLPDLSPRVLLPYPKVTPPSAPVGTGATPNSDALVAGADTTAGVPKSDVGAPAPKEGAAAGCAAAPNVPPPLKGLDAGAKEKAGAELTVGVREGPGVVSCPPIPPKIVGVAVGILDSPPNADEDAGLAPEPELVVAARVAEPKKLPAGAVVALNPKAPPCAEGEAPNALAEAAVDAPNEFAAADVGFREGVPGAFPKAGVETGAPKLVEDALAPAPNPLGCAGAPNAAAATPNVGDVAGAPNVDVGAAAPNPLPPPMGLLPKVGVEAGAPNAAVAPPKELTGVVAPKLGAGTPLPVKAGVEDGPNGLAGVAPPNAPVEGEEPPKGILPAPPELPPNVDVAAPPKLEAPFGLPKVLPVGELPLKMPAPAGTAPNAPPP